MSAPSTIAKIVARQILDSRGRPTVEADVHLANGAIGRAAAPSGASTGRFEAYELRDGDANDHEGLGVSNAVDHVNGEIVNAVVGQDVRLQREIDKIMIDLDGTANLSRLGANAILAVSLAAARAAAEFENIPLYQYLGGMTGATMSMPMPMTNILSGGAHAGRGMDLQDFLVIPVGAESYSQALSWISRVRSSAAKVMTEKGLTTLLADEGGLSPGFRSAEQALELMVQSFEAAGLRPGEDAAIALDVAGSELFENGKYKLQGEGKNFEGAEMVDFVVGLAQRYPIISIEDGLEQEDWENWQKLTAKLPHIQIVGDDLLATNVERIQRAIKSNVANASLIKVNQNGSLSGALAAIAVSRDAGYATIVSARSGETEDTFIADLAVGTGAGQIKIGSVRNSERLAKYNQLLRIEQGASLPFAGVSGMSLK